MPSDTYTLTIADAGVSTPADGSVTTVKIADYNVAIAGTGVTTAKIVDGAVTTAKILDGTIVAGDLASNSVITAKVADLNITADKLAANAVTTAKITDFNVTADKIAANAVITAKILNGNVTTDKIADGNVTLAKLQTIPANKLLGNSSGSTGAVSNITCTSFGFTLLTSVDDVAARGHLGLGSLATQNSLSAATGGTGQISYTIGDILYASGTTALSKLASVATGNALISGGVGASPSYGKIGLTTHVSGLLPVANGGTGLATITGYVKGAGTSALTASATIPVADISGVLPVANGGTGQLSAVRGQISKMSGFTLVDVVTQNIYTPVTNAGTLNAAVNMTVGADSTFSLKNTSGITRTFRVYSSVDATATNNDVLGIKLYFGLAGSVLAAIDETECRAFTSSSSSAAKLVTSWMIELDPNEEIAVYVANHSGTGDITIQRARLIAEAII